MNVVDRAKNLLLHPSKEWAQILSEAVTLPFLFRHYILYLAIIPAAAAFLSALTWTSFYYGLMSALVAFLALVGAYFGGSYLADALAVQFKSEKNLDHSAKWVGYSLTGLAVVTVLNLTPLPSLIISLAGGGLLYQLLYTAAGNIKASPEDQRMVYSLAVAALVVVIHYVITRVAGSIFLPRIYYYYY